MRTAWVAAAIAIVATAIVGGVVWLAVDTTSTRQPVPSAPIVAPAVPDVASPVPPPAPVAPPEGVVPPPPLDHDDHDDHDQDDDADDGVDDDLDE